MGALHSTPLLGSVVQEISPTLMRWLGGMVLPRSAPPSPVPISGPLGGMILTKLASFPNPGVHVGAVVPGGKRASQETANDVAAVFGRRSKMPHSRKGETE